VDTTVRPTGSEPGISGGADERDDRQHRARVRRGSDVDPNGSPEIVLDNIFVNGLFASRP
jgi:hypothetical protein